MGKQCETYKCDSLKVDKWEEVEILNEETGIEEINCDGVQIMEEKSEEKYLGDVISTDGKNIKNVKSRVSKGKGI